MPSVASLFNGASWQVRARGWLNDPRFWLALLFVLRLYNITQPPVEAMHSWRQITGVMVARNYLEDSNNFCFPRRDWNNGGTGIIGMELPVLNYGHYLLAEAFGYRHWYGRLLNLGVTTIGLGFFFRLVREVTGHRAALLAMLLLGGSLWFVFARKIMPDTFSLSLTLVGLFYGLRYLWYGGGRRLALYGAIGGLGVLCKIPALVLLGGLAPLVLDRWVPGRRRAAFAGASVLIAAAAGAWYFGWNPYLAREYGTFYNAGLSLRSGFRDLVTHPALVADNFYFDAMKYSGFALFLGGLAGALYRRQTRLLWPALAMMLLMIGYAGKSGYLFYEQNYYILPFVPAMALLAGWGAAQLRPAWLGALVVALVLGENLAHHQRDFQPRPSQAYLLQLEGWADRFSERGDLFAINADRHPRQGTRNPQQLYFAHREGWLPTDSAIVRVAHLQHLAAQGCDYALVNKHRLSPPQREQLAKLPFPAVFENERYRALRLRRP
jgi:hypothetical protein